MKEPGSIGIPVIKLHTNIHAAWRKASGKQIYFTFTFFPHTLFLKIFL